MRHRSRICYPGYRYCGPGCSGPGAPVNAVDNCCYYHDKCYQQYGPSKYCDDLFQQCLMQHKNPHTRMGRHANFMSNVIRYKNFF